MDETFSALSDQLLFKTTFVYLMVGECFWGVASKVAGNNYEIKRCFPVHARKKEKNPTSGH